MTTDVLLIVLLAGVLIPAAVNDLRFQRIPNLLTYPTMAVAFSYHFMTNGVDGLQFAAEGLALGIAILILPYLMGGMGAGDAKLMGAVGAIIGPRGVFVAFLCTAIVGGIYALILFAVSRQYSRGFFVRYATTLKTFVFTGQFIPIPPAEDEKKPKLCYGVAIALGTLFSVFLESSGYVFPI
jgi:prepilin peptidase CpaA